MSLNWVMLSETPSESRPYVPLPNEKPVFRAPARTSIKIKPVADLPSSSSVYPGNMSSTTKKFQVSSSSGFFVLTTHRIIYLPSSPSSDFQSFSAPLPNVRDSHVVQPFFGPNQWCCIVLPVRDGGFPVHSPLDLTFTFKDGAAFEFHDAFVRIRERMQEGIDHIDDLPTYSSQPANPSQQYAPTSTTSSYAETMDQSAVDNVPPPYSVVSD
ncbi:uncharacterized protein V1516DRAFT_667554 [Lipomyces oligophaga]|uniref:uncharacterized protein n=1 Tax=Lipomyces oligophaga TaxID=45792 RepID=UPI0034CF8DFD